MGKKISVSLSFVVALCACSMQANAYGTVSKPQGVSGRSSSSSSESVNNLRMMRYNHEIPVKSRTAAMLITTSATMIASFFLQSSFMIQPAYASDASKLYFEAEEAIKSSEANFKDLSSQW